LKAVPSKPTIRRCPANRLAVWVISSFLRGGRFFPPFAGK
jgi:hypothetical protein